VSYFEDLFTERVSEPKSCKLLKNVDILFDFFKYADRIIQNKNVAAYLPMPPDNIQSFWEQNGYFDKRTQKIPFFLKLATTILLCPLSVKKYSILSALNNLILIHHLRYSRYYSLELRHERSAYYRLFRANDIQGMINRDELMKTYNENDVNKLINILVYCLSQMAMQNEQIANGKNIGISLYEYLYEKETLSSVVSNINNNLSLLQIDSGSIFEFCESPVPQQHTWIRHYALTKDDELLVNEEFLATLKNKYGDDWTLENGPPKVAKKNITKKTSVQKKKNKS
jgi:hypothetical protein